jgi:hypothetical protein
MKPLPNLLHGGMGITPVERSEGWTKVVQYNVGWWRLELNACPDECTNQTFHFDSWTNEIARNTHGEHVVRHGRIFGEATHQGIVDWVHLELWRIEPRLVLGLVVQHGFEVGIRALPTGDSRTRWKSVLRISATWVLSGCFSRNV